jgi:transcriptional regulator with XRE-family HTH domain
MVNIPLLKRIAQWRKHHGVSAKEISEETGMSLSYISQIESGTIDIRISTLIRYTDAIGVAITWIKSEFSEQLEKNYKE